MANYEVFPMFISPPFTQFAQITMEQFSVLTGGAGYNSQKLCVNDYYLWLFDRFDGLPIIIMDTPG